MDITSYLLGKKAGGGGGEVNLQNKSVTITENTTQTINADAGYDGLKNVSVTTNVSSHNWSAIGYSGEPSAIQDGYDYALQIMNEWQGANDLTEKFALDKKLMFMPLVDTSMAAVTVRMFNNCNSLFSVPLLDTSNVVFANYMFQTCMQLRDVPLLDLGKCEATQYMFANCESIETIPAFDTSKVSNMRGMFQNCKALKNLPVLNTSKVSGTNSFQDFLSSCASLTDQSLDNVLQMCANATSYTATKTLAKLGLTSSNYPASKIQALPHYQDFIDAGWTIGY